MKKYIVEFTLLNGKKEEIEFLTDKIDWCIEQFSRNKEVVEYEIINERTLKSKKMLFG
jgi:hypothetical protein